MAFNHENPNVNYEMGAWDYYINEVKTFNERLESYQEEVNQKLSDQDEEIVTFKTNVNNQIGTLRIQLADFERDINATFSQWTEDQEEIFNQELAAFRAEVETIGNNVVTYVSQHIDEWSLEALTVYSIIHNNLATFDIDAPETSKPLVLGYSEVITPVAPGTPSYTEFNTKYINDNKIYPLIDMYYRTQNNKWRVVLDFQGREDEAEITLYYTII